MAEGPRQSVSVAAVVVDGSGRGLLIRRCDNGHWEPPGGVLELGENSEVAGLADQAYAIRILDALDFAAPPAVRAHDGVRLI